MTSASKEIQPLVLQGVNNTSDDVIAGNLAATFARGYTAMQEVKDYQGPVSVVGAGPSLSWTYTDLVGDVIACNSAHDFLIGKGVIPKYAMVWDAHPVMERILTPHKDVTYLIASRCHPSVFEKLKDYKVLVWHALGGDGIEQYLIDRNRLEPMVAGGSASAMRGVYLAGALGYTKEMHLFGIDSCYSEGKTHVNESIVAQNKIQLRVCGKWFTVAPWMAMQAGDAKVIFPDLQKMGVRLVVHGRGLLPYCSTFLGVETPDVKINWYEKLRREVHAVILLFLQIRNSPQLLGGSNAGV